MSTVQRWERATDLAVVQHADMSGLKSLAFWIPFILWMELDKATNIDWIDMVTLVIGLSFTGVMMFDGIGWMLDKRYREFLRQELKTKAQTWTDVPVVERIEVVDGEVRYSTYRENETPTRFPSRVRLDALWGAIEQRGRIRLVKRDMYQTAFSFSSSVFATQEDKDRFLAHIRNAGAKVIER